MIIDLNDIKSLATEYGRYNRQMIIPGFGLEGQQKLKYSKVLVIGAGGLGSPILLYLAAAGVGTIGVVDFDTVDESNLQRQILFRVSEIGKPKADAAKERLEALNPHIQIISYNLRLTSVNALNIIHEYDVVADCTDNFPARYLINDACLLLNKPNVYASVFQFEGQLSVFNYTNEEAETGPNYRDLYPSPPLPGSMPNCAEAGVLGVLPGIIGCMQANEIIKVITGIGEPLSGKFFVFDALTFKTRIFNISPDEQNPVTGKNPTITTLIDYEQFCKMNIIEKAIKEINVDVFDEWVLSGEPLQVIDVREPGEYAEANIGALLIPLATVTENARKIDRDKKVVVHCRSGVRSVQAIRELEEKFGFDNLYNLKGGIIAIQQKRLV